MEEATAILTKSRGLSKRVATFSNRLIGESDALAVEIKGLQQATASAESAARRHPEPQLANEVLTVLGAAKEVVRGLGPGGDLRKLCKPRPPFMLRLLLGDKVNLVTARPDESIAMKEEYHRFRDKSALVMLVVPALLLAGMWRADALASKGVKTDTHWQHSFTPGLMTGVQCYFGWLAYFYLALAMRENVLLINGSGIRPWWIIHHYISASASLVLLGLPVYSPAVYSFCRLFFMWSCFQALVMQMQNMYQRRRMYTRIALGRNSAMDVVSGESSGTSGQLLMLYPLLFLLQVSQFAIGCHVAWRTLPALLAGEGWLDTEAEGSDLRGMRGVGLVGLTFCYLACRNFQVTIRTITEKRAYRQRHLTQAHKGNSKGKAQ